MFCHIDLFECKFSEKKQKKWLQIAQKGVENDYFLPFNRNLQPFRLRSIIFVQKW